MRIAHNISAVNAFNLLKDANDTLQGTILSLSTGMRINSAADDASGLAVSEKMRAQMGGIDTAAKNTQDGISLLQTAEGALESVTSILQKMRELSVQSANDTLTQEDRNYLQAEIDQLKQEIDRTAHTTQFNKKKILNGEAGFEWSGSDLGLRAIVSGSAGGLYGISGDENVSGNYDLEISVDEQGKTQVQKSQIINVQEIEARYYDQEILINEGTDATGATSGKGWTFGGNSLTINANGTYFISGTLSDSGNTITTGKYIQVNSGVKATIVLRDVSITAEQYAFSMNGAEVDLWIDPGEHNNAVTLKANEGGYHTAAVQAGNGAKLNISSMAGDFSTAGKLITIGSEHGAGIGSSCYGTTADAGEITIYGGTIEATGGWYAAGIGGGCSGGTRPGSSGKITIHGGYVTAQGGTGGAGIGSGGSENDYSDPGSVTITGGTVIATGGADENHGYGLPGQGAGIGGGGHASGTTINISSNANVTVNGFTDANQTESIGYGQYGTGATVNQTTDRPPAAREAPERPDPVRVVKFRDYELSEIRQFYDDDGKFLFEDPQKLTVTQGNGKSASVTLYASDTMYDVAEKINKTIAEDLGQGKYTDNANSFCTIADGTKDSEAVYTLDFDESAVKSTMLVRSVVPGKEGELHFSGSEALLNALGLNTLQEASETVYSTTIRDAHTGKLLSEGLKSTGSTIHNAIGDDVDVKFDSMATTNAKWNAKKNKYDLTSATYSATLHLKENPLKLQTGANEGEKFEVKIGDMSASALGISELDITSRESAAHATVTIDNAIDKVLAQRAQLGASQSTLEHTMSRLAIAGENMTKAESKIRDADMAKMMMALTKFQIKTQAGISMLGQANQVPQQVLSLIR